LPGQPNGLAAHLAARGGQHYEIGAGLLVGRQLLASVAQ